MADRTVSYVFRGNFTNLQAGLAAGGKSVHDFGDKLSALDKNGAKMRRGLDTLGNSAGKMGLVAAAGLGAIVVAAASFDKSMSGVQAATHETAANMELLRAAALKAGADTAFSATEAAAGVTELAKAGVATKDILAGGLTGALDLAAAGQLEVAEAAEIAATAMTQFKLEGEQIPHVADLLAAGAGKAQGSVQDMGMALKQSGLVAAQTGLTIEETTGTLAAFASAGLIGSDAGTSFKTMLQSLTPSGVKAREEMERLNITAYDAQGNFVGMAEFAESLKNGLKDLSVEQQNAAMKTIFGSDAVRAASVVFAQGKTGIQGWIDKVNDSGYAAETAAIQMDNLAGDLEAFKGSLETALIGAGEGSQGPLRSLVQQATGVVNAFNGLPPVVQGTVTKMLAATAVLGGGLFIGSKVIQGIANTRQALSDLGFTANTTRGRLARLGGTAVGVLAVGSAVGTLADNMGRIDAQNLDRALQALSRGNVTDDINDIVGNLEELEAARNSVDLGEIVTIGGVFGDTSLDKYADNVAQMDERLAGLVETGQAAVASGVFERLTALAEEQGVSAEETASHFDQYALALKNATPIFDAAGVEIFGLTVGADRLATAQNKHGEAARGAAKAEQLSAKALAASRKAASETARSFFNVGESVNKAKVSLGSWIRDMEKQADALRNFRLNAEKAANKGLRQGLIAALQEAGPAGALRMKQLANATDKEIARANRAWARGQREIDKYTTAVGGAKDAGPVNTKVNAQTEDAVSKLNYFQQLLRGLDGDTVTTHVKTIAPRPTISADGSTVPKSGRGYADRYPYLLADGEEVISNRYGQADRNRALLKAINAGYLANGGTARPYDAPRFGDGGTARYVGQVSSSRSSGPSSMVVTGTLQTPWGPAHIEGLARDVAREEIDADRRFETTRRGK